MAVVAVGIDVCKATLEVAIWLHTQGQRVGAFATNEVGLTQRATQVQQLQQQHAGEAIHLRVEPTGGSALAVACCAHRQGWHVRLPNPASVRQWASGSGYRAKTDQHDAVLLAHSTAEREPVRWQPVAREISELERLLRRRADLEQLLRQEHNRQAAVAQRPNVAHAVPATSTSVLEALEKALADVEQALKEHLKADPALKQDARIVRLVPGVGPKNVVWVLLLLHRWNTLTHGQGDGTGLVAYAGRDPQPYERGRSVHKRASISRTGDRHTRRMLCMGAFGGVRGMHPLRTLYQGVVARGKTKMTALVACARNRLTWAWAVFRTKPHCDAARLAQRSTHGAPAA